ncbi:hypothetical protein [Pseudogemmobacter faecipullorum]|uniref:Uncharacterized protein n=1 Tax=Pseudogemmobacter faecipullorum TaxID=2755041 RepID=A0ABS8CPX0_9RHOB|nr:hypothetical protein [Pseudogemmobacter faecipullorum]MCB5411452.1 hypothetical protein [Pseudogemmobacter faecipullorum]
MAPRKPQDLTPEQLFLQPLAQLALQDPEIEGLVFWGEAAGWPEDPAEALESEEIAFWAEGLLPEGFSIEWRILAAEDGKTPGHIRLYAWEAGAAPPAETAGPVLAAARWPVTA